MALSKSSLDGNDKHEDRAPVTAEPDPVRPDGLPGKGDSVSVGGHDGTVVRTVSNSSGYEVTVQVDVDPESTEDSPPEPDSPKAPAPSPAPKADAGKPSSASSLRK